jgi:hypothetical protein
MDIKEINTKLIASRISKNLMNKDVDKDYRNQNQIEYSNKNLMFEQYKLLVDSSHKIEERRASSNNIFIGINTLLITILVQIHPKQLGDVEVGNIITLLCLILIGILISWDWLKVIASYKKLNSLNYSLIEAFENLLPTYVFSLRGKMEAEEADSSKPSSRANIILISENLLPKAFVLIYSIYFLTILIIFFRVYLINL